MSKIYLIEAENCMVKIGVASHPKSRLESCATHSPVLVRLVAMWPGNITDERALHRRFQQFRSHREWFSLAGELADFVNERRGDGLDRIHDWSEIGVWCAKEQGASTRALRSASMKKAWSDPVKKADWIKALRRSPVSRVNA